MVGYTRDLANLEVAVLNVLRHYCGNSVADVLVRMQLTPERCQSG